MQDKLLLTFDRNAFEKMDQCLASNLGVSCEEFRRTLMLCEKYIQAFDESNGDAEYISSVISEERLLDIDIDYCYHLMVRALQVPLPSLGESWIDTSHNRDPVEFCTQFIPGDAARELYLCSARRLVSIRGDTWNRVKRTLEYLSEKEEQEDTSGGT